MHLDWYILSGMPRLFLKEILPPKPLLVSIVYLDSDLKGSSDRARYIKGNKRVVLVGSRFRLITNHAPLQRRNQAKKFNPRVTNWFLAFQKFSFEVKHRPGDCQNNVYTLSNAHCSVSSV